MSLRKSTTVLKLLSSRKIFVSIRTDRADPNVFLKIKNLLTAPEIARLVGLSRELHFVGGRVSNPANVTKDNLQVDHTDPQWVAK